MDNFIFPPVITLEQKIRPQEQPAGVPKNANRAFGSLPCSHKEAAFDASLSELRNEHPSA